MKIILSVLIFPAICVGQVQVEGKVVSSKTKKPVPFATVGLIKENTGINADDSGHFSITRQLLLKDDSLSISCVGFETAKFPLMDSANAIFALNEKTNNLPEIILRSKEVWKQETLNSFTGKGNVSFASYQSPGGYSQVARLFSTPVNNASLTRLLIRITRYRGQSINSIFRLRVYGMDSITKGPGADLCSEVIEVRAGKKNVEVDLEPYKIVIPERNFFVSIEWLRIPFNEEITFAKEEDENVEKIHYRPSIAATGIITHPSYQSEPPYLAWTLDYQNKWRPHSWCTNLFISASIKY